MVKMRLFRMGDKKNPIYRVVVVDSRKEPARKDRGDGEACEVEPFQDEREEVEEVIVACPSKRIQRNREVKNVRISTIYRQPICGG